MGRVRTLCCTVTAFVLLSCLTSVRGGTGTRGARPSASGSDPIVVVILRDEEATTRREATALISKGGGRVLHAFDGLLVAAVPYARLVGLRGAATVRRVSQDTLQVPARGKGSQGFRLGAEAWNLVFRGRGAARGLFRRSEMPTPPFDREHAWPPPPALAPKGRPGPSERSSMASASSTTFAADESASVASVPTYWAGPQNTSEYLAGAVSVNLFLLESDGTIDASTENWTADREADVVAGVTAGLEWLRGQEPQSQLRFVYHVITGRTDSRARTGYEPIRRPADPKGSTGEDLWVKQALTKMGYASGDRFARSRALANDTRVQDGTDWAVNVFVVDSYQDFDGTFADGYFAYSWIGGPHLVMTYDNQSWGVDRMDMVARHEILHSFYAFDEYAASGCTCSEHRGYLDGLDTNCVACNPAAAPCVMISNTAFICPATRRQIGWSDLDGDGVIDVVGEDPDTFLDSAPPAVCGPLVLMGLASVVPPTNRNPATYTPQTSISVNRLARVEAQDDGGGWASTSPSDGAWGGYQEAFYGVWDLPAGAHALELRAVDDHGNVDLSPVQVGVQVLPRAVGVGNGLRVERGFSPGAASLLWGEPAGAISYRVYRAASPPGPWVLMGETASPTWTDGGSGDGYFDVRSVDGCGADVSP